MSVSLWIYPLAFAQPFLVLGDVSSVGWTYLLDRRPRTGRVSVTSATQGGYVWHVSTIALKPPFADASPVEIRAALLAEDQPEFDRQWREALTIAAEALSLDEVHDTLESWRRVAWLVSEHGHDGYRRMMAQAQETLRTGQSPPGSVGIDEIEALIRARLGRQVYRVETYREARDQIAALPDDALASYAEALGVLKLIPWNGEPINKHNPTGPVRTLPFGAAGMVTYLILEDQRRVDVITVVWAG